MKKLFTLMVVVVAVATACQKEGLDAPKQSNETSTELAIVNSKTTRSYDEALKIAEDALQLVDGDDTRATKRRVIKRTEGQTVMRSVTRGSEAAEEPIMYIFNNENDEGFTIIAANKDYEPLIAVTEYGNYTYGEPTGVEPFDNYMKDVVEAYSLIPPIIPIDPDDPDDPDDPYIPEPGCIVDTVQYNHVEYGPYLVTKWGQSGIYGSEASNGLAGCGPTAMAQIMAYHRRPSSLEITYTFREPDLELNWDELIEHYSGIGYSGLNGWYCNCGCDYETLSKLMREIGHRAGASYNDGQTSTDEYDIRDGFNNLNYTATVNNDLVFEITSWHSTVKSDIISDLSNRKPLIMCGVDDDEGHAWVVDGYMKHDHKFDYYFQNYDTTDPSDYVYSHSNENHYEVLHFNWGWNGRCDGWFSHGCLRTNNAMDYDDDSLNNNIDYNFIWQNELIQNIAPTWTIIPITPVQ